MKSYLCDVDKLPIERSLTDLSLVKRSSKKSSLLLNRFVDLYYINHWFMLILLSG
jgi:hypothetical protein